MAEDCIFCKLGETSSNTIFDDGTCYIVTDRFPSEFGHLLVISKKHYENMLETPDDVISRMFVVAKDYGMKIKEKLGASGMTIATNVGRDSGQIISHLHIHIVPKYPKRVDGFLKHREITDREMKEIKEKLNS